MSVQSGFVNVTTLAVPGTAPTFADDTGIDQRWTLNTAITSVTVPAASGSPAPTYAPVGALPAGITFSTSSRVISGTPTVVGSGAITIRSTNSEGADDWTVAYTIAVATAPVGIVTLEIDWGNDGTFSHVAADVTGDLVKHSLRTTRGRTLQSRGNATAGRLQARLWNLTSKYSTENSSSPIFMQDLTGVRVRAKLDGVTVWGGILDTPSYRQWPVRQVDIIALGVLSTLRQPVSVAGQSSASIGTIAKLVVAAAGLSTTHVAGDKVLSHWAGVSDQYAFISLRDLEETEEGFLFERLDGELALEAEDARSTGASAISALTLTDQIQAATDVPLLRGSHVDVGFRYIVNVINVLVATLEESGEITLVSSPAVVIPAGTSQTVVYSYPSHSSPANHRSAASWIAPVSGTDYTAQAGLTLTGTVVGENFQVAFANSSGASITVSDLEIRGKAIMTGVPIIVPSKDDASILKFKEREYLRPAKLFTDIGMAQEYADGRVRHGKDPIGWLAARWPASYAAEQARSLDLGRRITVERLGAAADYYIEGTSMAVRGFVRMEYLLSPVPGVTRALRLRW